MKSPKPEIPRWVWRISQSAPLGEWVDLNAQRPPAVPRVRQVDFPPEVAGGSWVVSSLDLLHGTEVDASGDTVPDDLFDELFPPPSKDDSTDPA